MCRNINTLFNFEPPATDEEIRAASTQFVRKISGSNKPSKANVAAFERAVDDVSTIVQRLLNSLTTSAPTRNRETEAAKTKIRAKHRFAARTRGESPNHASAPDAKSRGVYGRFWFMKASTFLMVLGTFWRR